MKRALETKRKSGEDVRIDATAASVASLHFGYDGLLYCRFFLQSGA
jgi:hypothetical protein